MRHLYWAERQEINGPFGKPKPIESCSFPEGEAYPTITPDGLEMFFMRYGEEPRFYYCARTSTSADFGTPAPWSIPPGAAMGPGKWRLEAPQFFDPLRLLFSASTAGAFPRKYFLAQRTDRKSPFGSVREFPVYTTWAQWYVPHAGVLRGYYGDDRGLFLSTRRSKDRPFAKGIPIADTSLTGPIDGPFWVAPQEDVVFYCSPGPGEKLGSSRKLWMIRF